MAKIFTTSGTGASQTLNEADSNKLKVYDDYASIDTTELVDGEIVSTRETSADGSNVYDYVDNKIEDSQSYSTEETLTGGVWIDGKPIYRKVVNCGNMPNNTIKNIAHNISNLGKVISMNGFATDGITNISLPYVSADGANYQITVNVSSTNVELYTRVNRSSYSGYIILEYTKTTD